jgi:hypothetical protein
MAAQHILFFCIFLLATLDASGRRERPRLSIITEISHESDEKADFYSDDEKEDAPLIQQHPPTSPIPHAYNVNDNEYEADEDDTCTQQDCCHCLLAALCCLGIIGCGEAIWFTGKALWH